MGKDIYNVFWIRLVFIKWQIIRKLLSVENLFAPCLEGFYFNKLGLISKWYSVYFWLELLIINTSYLTGILKVKPRSSKSVNLTEPLLAKPMLLAPEKLASTTDFQPFRGNNVLR